MKEHVEHVCEKTLHEAFETVALFSFLKASGIEHW